MLRSFARTALFLLAAIAPCLPIQAGEFARPVPTNAQVTRFTRFNIRYTLRDIVADGVQKVDFYITDDMGATWRFYGEDPDRISPMTVEVPGEGVYGFVCVATDRYGNREREPVARTRPETVIIVDRTPPDAKWLSPVQDILGRGQEVLLSWESSDEHFGETPVKIQYATNASGNHDRNANWVDLAENLAANGTHNWTPPASERYNFRLIAEDRAGNMAVAYNPATIAIDNTPPYITDLQPLRSNKLENAITVNASDGERGSGVKEYSLYTSDNGAGSWTLVKETGVGGESVPVKRRPGDSITWKAPRSGEYPLWPVVFDEAGNATPLPQIGVAGPFILTIDNEPPQVTLSNSFLQGRNTVLSNDSRRLEWTSYDPHIQEGSARIALSLDNGDNWQELRSGLPVNGFETISFPFGSESEEAKMRITVADNFGNVGEAVSETFKLSRAETTIDSVTPRGGSTGSLEDYLGGSSTPSVPSTPATPSTSDGGWFGYDSTPSTPAAPVVIPPSPQLPSSAGGSSPYDVLSPLPGGGSSTDIYGGSGDIYQRPIGSLNYNSESTAGSLPRAMMNESQTASAPAQPQSPYGQPAAPAPSVDTWAPTPGATASTAGSMSDWQSSPSVPAQPTLSTPPADAGTPPWTASPSQPSSSGGDWAAALPPPPGGGAQSGAGDIASLPPWSAPSSGSESLRPPSPSPAAPAPTPTPMPTPEPAPSAPAGGDDWAFGGISAPPMPTPAGDTQFPEMPALGDMGDLSLDGFGGGLSLPDAPAAAPTLPAGDLAAAPEQQDRSGLPWPATTEQMPPRTEQGPPPAVPGIESGGSDIFTPPPLQSAPSRPANPRALAEHYIKESKAFRDQGRPDLALDAATKAVESDTSFAGAYVELSQVNARKEPPDYVRAANLAKEATGLQNDWETWWNCADVFYIWAHASNREIQSMLRSGQNPPINLVDERNSTLSNASIAINNASSIMPQGNREAAKKVMVTQGMIAYLRALTIPEPANPGVTEGPAFDDYRRQQATYKTAVAPLLQEAMPYFQNAISSGGAPEYNELFQMGIINFRLAGLERDTGNPDAALRHYTDAARYLVDATQAASTPKEGPREAYYMLALSHDQLANQPGGDRARNRELALRYWRQTADFYEPGTPYRMYAEQRIDAITGEMGM